MGAAQARTQEPLTLPPATHSSLPPANVDVTAALASTISPPKLPSHLATYLDWLFSLPPSSAPQFALYLLHLTQATLLPPTPPPPIADVIAAPPPALYPPHLRYEPPPHSDGGMVYAMVGAEDVRLMVWSVLASRQRMMCCFRMMRDGPLLAASCIAQALLAALAMPLPAQLTSSAFSPSPSPTPLPLQLLRSHQLRHALSPLLPRIDWALSPAALSDEQSSEAAYYLHEVEVVQVRRLREDVLRLMELMCEEEGWVRAQRRAVLLGVWRGQCRGGGGGGDGGGGGGGGSLGVLGGDAMFDVQLLREMFSYVWE